MKDLPSRTALLVARGVAYESTHPRHRHLVPDDAGRLAREFVSASGGRVPSAASAFSRAMMWLAGRLTVPGFTLEYVLRKRRIEQIARSAIGAGFRQLIVLGAGLDTLAIRLAPQITAIEIDHPTTQELKRRVAPHDAVELLAADFSSDSLMDVLRRSNRYGDAEPALFLAEGVFMYLKEGEIRGLLQQLRARPAATRLIFTFLAPRDPINFQNATWIADTWLRRVGEPCQWAIAPEDVAAFLASEHFELLELARDIDFHDGYRAARGEHIAVAQFSP